MLFEPKVCFDLRARAGFISFACLGWLGCRKEQPPGGAKTGKAVDPGARGEDVEGRAARDQRRTRGSCERCKEHPTGGKPGARAPTGPSTARALDREALAGGGLQRTICRGKCSGDHVKPGKPRG